MSLVKKKQCFSFHSLRPLHFAARHGHQLCLEILLEFGAEVGAGDFYDWQAIHEAAMYGRLDCLELLLENGAKVDAEAYNSNGPNTPLHYAARHGHVKCVELLLRNNANWNSCNRYGETPLHFTAMRGHVDCMQALVDAGISLSTRNKLCSRQPRSKGFPAWEGTGGKFLRTR